MSLDAAATATATTSMPRRELELELEEEEEEEKDDEELEEEPDFNNDGEEELFSRALSRRRRDTPLEELDDNKLFARLFTLSPDPVASPPARLEEDNKLYRLIPRLV